MRNLLLLAAFAAQLPLAAQLLLVEPGPDDPRLLRFNPEFIARNGVKSVSGRSWVKRDGRPMQALDRYHLYRFGTDGRLGYSNSSFGHPGSGVDTASVMYSYDTAGRLLQELHNDLHGYFALRMGYDALGRVEREEHVRLENLGKDRYRFVEGSSTVISDERLQYTVRNDTVWARNRLNDRGRPYEEEIFTADHLGYLRRIERRNLITQRRGSITFHYDAKGRLDERQEQPDLGAPQRTTWKWTYDGVGNPLTCDLLHNGTLAQHSEYLYAEGTLFLKAVITRNEESGVIEIVRYETVR